MKPTWIRLLSVILALVLPAIAIAQEQPQLPDDADIRIIVDISGSMKTNDPYNLRQPAVRLLARMLPDGATAGVWTFGQYVNMLVGHGAVDEDWRNRAILHSERINSVALRTNLGRAIEVAGDGYMTDGDLTNTHLILLTDGKVDISDDEAANQRERERILGPLLRGLVDQGAKLHTVALSEEADIELLDALATESGGSYNIAPSAEALTRAFLGALNAAAPQQQIPLEGNRFQVDEGVREFTALIFTGGDKPAPLELVSPDNQVATARNHPDNMSWVSEPGYDLVTVREPKSGEWNVSGELGEGSRVTVVSDLRMVVSPIPASFGPEAPVEVKAAFYEKDNLLKDADFLGVIRVSMTITSEDGRSGTKVLSDVVPPEDGVYRDTIARLPMPGTYQIELVADGQTFSRKYSGQLRFVVPGQATETLPKTEGQGTLDIGQDMSPTEPGEEPAAMDSGFEDEGPGSEQPGSDVAQAQAVPEGGPIDTSLAEEVVQPEQPELPAEEQEPAQGWPWWLITGIAAGVVVAGGAGAYLVVRRKRREAGRAVEKETREGVADLEEETPEPEPEPEPPVASAEIEEEAPEPEEIQDEDIPVVADSEISDDLLEPEAEPEPSAKEEPSAEVEPSAEEESSAEEEPSAKEEASAEEKQEEPEEDEFGLEDFDLSDIDDLPDVDDEETAPEDRDGRADDEKKRD